MLKRKKIVIKNDYGGDYFDIDSKWIRAENSTGFFDDILNKPEGALVIWSMHEDKMFSYEESLKWVRENKRDEK